MRNVLLVIEDRVLLKKIEQYYTCHPEYILNFNLMSCHAFSFFVELDSKIMVVDASVSCGYRALIQKCAQVQRNYRLILLVDHKGQEIHQEHIININKKALTQEVFFKAHEAPEEKKTKGNAAFIQNAHPDQGRGVDYEKNLISVIYAKNTSKNGITRQSLSRLEEIIGHYCKVEAIATEEEEDDLFIVIDAYSLQLEMDFAHVAQLIFKHISTKYAIFVMENIKYSDLQFIYSHLENICELSYFYEGQLFHKMELERTRSRKFSLGLIDQQVGAIMEDILRYDMQETKSHLNKLFEVVKTSNNVFVRDYARFMLENTYSTVTSIMNVKPQSTPLLAASCDQECSIWNAKLMEIAYQTSYANTPLTLVRVITYTYLHFSENISLESVACDLKLTKNYISRLFKQSLSTTFLDFLQNEKMKKANFLLVHSDYKVFEIAKLLSYDDAHYFSRLYRKRMGMTPKEYRDAHVSS